MSSSTQVHVLDQSSTRRAKVAYQLADSPLSVQVYDSLSDFERFKPQRGIVLLSGEDTSISFEDVACTLRNAGVVLPIALFAENPVPASIVEAMLSGAIDYLDWPLQSGELEAAIERIASRAELSIERERKVVTARNQVRSLSRRETEVLSLMISGDGNKEIAQRLDISPRTVEIHRANLLRKLNVQSSAEALRIGIYAGLDRE